MRNKLTTARAAVLACAVAAGAALVPLQANAGSFQVFVGYADDLRPSPFFPNPYGGADIFQGNLGALDSGAVRIFNNGATNITLNDLKVTINPAAGPQVFQLWSFGAGLTLAPGQNAVFGSTANYNFDTSDFAIVAQNILDNCSVGPTAATAVCINNAPKVDVTVDGILNNLVDTGHVLNTGGFDLTCCTPDGNESLQWRLIGTTGVQDPGGSVPEPATIALTLAGVAAALRRRRA